MMYLLVGVLCGFILGFYSCVRVSYSMLAKYVKNHTGDKVSNELLVDIVAEADREPGEIIQVNTVKEYLKEHHGEEIQLGDIIKDDV